MSILLKLASEYQQIIKDYDLYPDPEIRKSQVTTILLSKKFTSYDELKNQQHQYPLLSK